MTTNQVFFPMRVHKGHSHFYNYIESFEEDHHKPQIDLDQQYRDRIKILRDEYLHDDKVEESKPLSFKRLFFFI